MSPPLPTRPDYLAFGRPDFSDAEIDAVARVLRSGWIGMGQETVAFEQELAKAVGAPYVVTVDTCTSAIFLSLVAEGVAAGDEVITPSLTWCATANASIYLGAKPVFCDVDPATFCVTPETVRAALTRETKVVMVVHLFGNIAPVEAIAALGVPVLEDAAQAAGSRTADGRRAGTFGAAATFSFFPSKNLGAFGDAGAVATGDDAIAERVRMLRFHGSRDKVSFELVGHNSRLDELQAALLRIELPHLDAWCDGRRAGAAHYADAGLGELATLPQPVDACEPAWHLYVIRHERPEALEAAFKAAGIGCKRYYTVPLHKQEAMRPWGDVELPGTDEAARTHIAIPMSPVLTREQAGAVVAAMRDADLG